MVNYNFFFFSDPENEASKVTGTLKLTNKRFNASLTIKSSGYYQSLTSQFKFAVCH